MPFSPDYSEFLRMKKIQKTFEIDRQVSTLKFRATQPYGGYTPTYRIGYLPPNLFLPGRLYPPAPAPEPPVSGIHVDFEGQASSPSIPIPSTPYNFNFFNLLTDPVSQIIISANVGFDSSSTVKIDGTQYPVLIDGLTGNITVTVSPSLTITPTMLIEIITPTTITSVQFITS